jgi:undecaprenol kinase
MKLRGASPVSDSQRQTKNQPLHRRMRFAIAGIGETWRRERSFRAHILVAVLVVVVMAVIHPPVIWWALVAFIIAAVLAIEVMNTAVEALIDHLHPDIHPQIRVVKDMAAGAVLLIVIGAVVVGGLLLAQSVWGGS